MNLPSPVSSPSSNSADLPTQPSRKRQRSQSMHSGTSSSSLKRSASENPSQDPVLRVNDSDSLEPPSDDIDSYMAEQGEAQILPSFQSTSTPNYQAIAPSNKVNFADAAKTRTMKVEETWYLVSRDWWKRWRSSCGADISKSAPVNESELGPVNNSPLLDQYQNLLSTLVEGVDVEYVPEELWLAFASWYGDSPNPIPRKVVARGQFKQPSLELHPLHLKVAILAKPSVTSSARPAIPDLVISCGETLETLCNRLAAAVVADIQSPYRIWKVNVPDDDCSSPEYPASSFHHIERAIVEASSKTLEEDSIENGDAFLVELKQDGKWVVDASASPARTRAIAPYDPPPPLFNSNTGFFDRMTSSTPRSFAGGFTKVFGSSKATSSVERYSKPVQPGTLGLGNMGNTCFMNSALQCLAHSQELSEYFLTGVFEDELNPDNPLGMRGAIAEAFGALLQRIWADRGTSTSYSPREFKSQLQRFAPQFSGYQQHDSQELVAFLLDGLHEDLNRVLKKPYVEKPDWEGKEGDDVALVELANKSWEGYMKRNDSVIVDLFQGQYQSTLICPECAKVSITFDPFMYLTLPLPIKKKWRHSIFYVPWDSAKPHVKVPVQIDANASFKDLRALLGRWMGAPPDNLLTLEIFNHRFYKNLDDNVMCGDMADNDTIVCFELPCHAQQSRSYKKQPGDPMIIPIYLADLNPPARTSYMTGRSQSMFGYPSVVVIDKQQATDLEAIYEAVVARLQRWTTNFQDLYRWEETPITETDVPIQINGIPVRDAITEISENGEVITIQDPAEEGDIVDEKGLLVTEEPADESDIRYVTRKVSPKHDIFNLRLQTHQRDYGTSTSMYLAARFESWEVRKDATAYNPILLREGDAFVCEFDEMMKQFYFGDDRTFWEHARWNNWEQFRHPEYEEAVKANLNKGGNRGIDIQDCLDEFTKQEKLGEDDLWYCPQCKKHQQATKKFDLWKAPDILVVHLKRFSNNRSLRDKIDAFVDFPVEGLDLTEMVGERSAAKRLLEQGHSLDGLGLGLTDEPLVYDLFGVDEHIGGLGGGHYRAYALNHQDQKWYHFDDSFVTTASPSQAVNANAYLLFYRRRSSTPLGGKTHEKVEAAKSKPESQEPAEEEKMTVDRQLPTPPNELSVPYSWHESRTPNDWIDGVDSFPSPPEDLPEFENHRFDALLPLSGFHDFADESQDGPNARYDFPESSDNQTSPTSSNEAEVDSDVEERWGSQSFAVEAPTSWDDVEYGAGPISPATTDPDPFSDKNAQKLDSPPASVSTFPAESNP